MRPESQAVIPANAKLALYAENVFNPQITVSQQDVAWMVDAPLEDGLFILDVGSLGVTGEISIYATTDAPGAESVSAEFTVAAEADHTPPMFDGIQAISYEFLEESPGLCQPGGFTVRVEVRPATDDWAPTHYQLYEVQPNDGLRYAGRALHRESGDSIILTTYAGMEEGTRCYLAFANDVGGNRAPQMHLGGTCVDLRRGGQMDAGVVDGGGMDGGFLDGGEIGPDASVKPDAATDAGTTTQNDTGTGSTLELDDRGGCGCTGARARTGGTGALAAFLLLFPLLALRPGR